MTAASTQTTRKLNFWDHVCDFVCRLWIKDEDRSDIKRAVNEIYSGFSVWTQLAYVALLAFCLYGMIVAGNPSGWCFSLSRSCEFQASALANALASDAFRTFLALVIAFLVAIRLKIQQQKGLLDAVEHYGIARALAYGYHRNFLQKALKHIKAHGGQKLLILKPATITELTEFNNEYLQRLKQKEIFVEKSVEIGKPDGHGRQVFVVLQSGTATGFYFDLPTTLHTIRDYFNCWNDWALENHRGTLLLSPEKIAERESEQVVAFFRELSRLLDDKTGRKTGATVESDEGHISDYIEILDGSAVRARLEGLGVSL